MRSSASLSDFSARRTACLFTAVGAAAVCSVSALAQGQKLTVPTSLPMAAQLVQHVPLKQGEPLRARLLYPVYVDNQLALPAGSVLDGRIVSLTPDKHRRIQGKLEGDFTPFREPVVAFSDIRFPDGATYSIESADAMNGVPILHLTAAAPHTKRAFIRAQFEMARQNAKDQLAMITAPGKGDRMLQFLYRQLPYHPQRIESGTAWTVTLTQPLEVPARANPTTATFPATAMHSADPNAPDIADSSGAELLHAYLTSTISSATAKPGDTFSATITQPVYDKDHRIAVPEGAVLIGTVTQAKPAKSFGRKGKLRFSFRELQLPGGDQQDVNGMLRAADASRAADLQIDSEGGVQPKQKNRTVVPMALSILASRALDTDGSQAANGAVASNGFGIVGRIAGIASAPRAVAATVGFYGAGLAIFSRWIAAGQDVTFVKSTRIDVLTTPARPRLADSAALSRPGEPTR